MKTYNIENEHNVTTTVVKIDNDLDTDDAMALVSFFVFMFALILLGLLIYYGSSLKLWWRQSVVFPIRRLCCEKERKRLWRLHKDAVIRADRALAGIPAAAPRVAVLGSAVGCACAVHASAMLTLRRLAAGGRGGGPAPPALECVALHNGVGDAKALAGQGMFGCRAPASAAWVSPVRRFRRLRRAPRRLPLALVLVCVGAAPKFANGTECRWRLRLSLASAARASLLPEYSFRAWRRFRAIRRLPTSSGATSSARRRWPAAGAGGTTLSDIVRGPIHRRIARTNANLLVKPRRVVKKQC